MNRHLFINKVRGIIHVGANSGGEANTYDIHDLRVAWIEPIPEVFQELQQNIAPFKRQKAYRYLIGEKDESEVVLHISTNAGLSSSVLPLQDTVKRGRMSATHVTSQCRVRHCRCLFERKDWTFHSIRHW